MQEEQIQNLERKIRETRQLSEENHELLQKIHRSLVWSRVLWVIYWIVIIGVAVGAFYFLEPYWDNVLEMYQSVQGQLEAGFNFGN